MKRLCPPGTAFIIWRSIFSFSSTATPASIRIGGGVESKFDLNNIQNTYEYSHRFSLSVCLSLKETELICQHCFNFKSLHVSNYKNSSMKFVRVCCYYFKMNKNWIAETIFVIIRKDHGRKKQEQKKKKTEQKTMWKVNWKIYSFKEQFVQQIKEIYDLCVIRKHSACSYQTM